MVTLLIYISINEFRNARILLSNVITSHPTLINKVNNKNFYQYNTCISIPNIIKIIVIVEAVQLLHSDVCHNVSVMQLGIYTNVKYN